jgi:hypothetical protein
MSKQTAVEWLVEKIIEDKLIDVKNGHQFIHLQSIAKQMEKEQIIDNIVQFGIKYHHKYSEGEIKKLCENGEQYYNETYKNETK